MKLRVLIPRWQLLQRIRDLAYRVLHTTYGCDMPVFVVVLDGAQPFATELLSHIQQPEVVYVRCKSYTGAQRGTLMIDYVTKGLPAKVEGRDVVIIDDILDSGVTALSLIEAMEAAGAKDVRVMTLLRRRTAPQLPRFLIGVGYTIESTDFVVGYGLDFNGQYRELSDICTLHQ